MSRYLFMISHPAHFHMFKHTIKNLQGEGHEIIAVIRPKDILEQLCVDYGLAFVKTKNRPKRFGMFGLAISLIGKTREVWKIVSKAKPDLLIGSDGVLAHIGFLKGIPSFECYEDDAQAIKLYALMFFPFYTHVISPEVCDAWLWNHKKIGYESYHELGYLHPNHFTPDRSVVNRYFPSEQTFFIIRFAQLTAHHDVGIHGITTEIAEQIIKILAPHGTIYITSERTLEPQFEKYRINIKPLDMHHVMAFASIYIGDSQTMAAEAGVLGTPFVRFNDFVGRLSYLNEIEDKYQLGFGHKTKDVSGFYQSINMLINTPNRKEICAEHRLKMLNDKIDYSKFLTWFVKEYPVSKKVMIENPNYQYNFR